MVRIRFRSVLGQPCRKIESQICVWIIHSLSRFNTFIIIFLYCLNIFTNTSDETNKRDVLVRTCPQTRATLCAKFWVLENLRSFISIPFAITKPSPTLARDRLLICQFQRLLETTFHASAATMTGLLVYVYKEITLQAHRCLVNRKLATHTLLHLTETVL